MSEYDYSIRPELNRKVIEACEWLVNSVVAGRISDDQFSTAVDALWMASAGLVNGPAANILEFAGNEVKARKKRLSKPAPRTNSILRSESPDIKGTW